MIFGKRGKEQAPVEEQAIQVEDVPSIHSISRNNLLTLVGPGEYGGWTKEELYELAFGGM